MTTTAHGLLGAGQDTGALLAAAQEQVRPALAQALDRLAARSRQAAGYHRGWWDADGRTAAIGGGGKAPLDAATRTALADLSAGPTRRAC